MKIGIDIDGVINNLEEYHVAFGSRFCYERGISFHLDIKEYELTTMYQWDEITEKQFYDTYYYIFLTSPEFIRIHAREIMQKLYGENELIIITARLECDVPPGISLSMYDITRNWLVDNSIPFHKLVFSPADKSQILQTYNIDIMIEDNPGFLQEANNISIPFLCFDTDYNRISLPDNVVRVYSWNDILHIIKALKRRGTNEELYFNNYYAR